MPDGFQKNLTQEHKTKRMGFALSFLERHEKDGGEFLTHIVTGDETWVSHVTTESKQQSMQWCHTSSPTKKKNSSRLSALAKSCARYSGTVMEFCSLITVQMDKQSMPRCTATPYNAYAGLFKTKAGDCSAPGWFFSTTTPVRIRLGKQQPYCSNFVGIRWITPPLQSGPRAKRLPSVSAHEAFSRWKAIPFRCKGENDSTQLVATTGGRLFRHRHSKTCDAIQQVPRFCW